MKSFLAAIPCAVCAAAVTLGPISCSSNSSSTNDASSMGPLPIGQVVPNCQPNTGAASTLCPSPAVCGGTLLSPTTFVQYCTTDCLSAACPSGTVCIMNPNVVIHDCLKSCTSDSDCNGGFACVMVGSQQVCWSPYKGSDQSSSGGSSGSSGSSSGTGGTSGGSSGGSSTSSGASGSSSGSSGGSSSSSGSSGGSDASADSSSGGADSAAGGDGGDAASSTDSSSDVVSGG